MVVLIDSDQHIESVEVPRLIVYGEGAISKLPEVCKRLGIQTTLVVSGPTSTKKIAKEHVIPLLEDKFQSDSLSLKDEDYFTLEKLAETTKNLSQTQNAVIVVGGGRTFDPVKVATSWAKTHYISVPTSSAHDGFASPYINSRLRRIIHEAHDTNGKPSYVSHSPLAIIGDVEIIKQQPRKMLMSGVGDSIANFVALKDWELAHRIRGELYDPYSATYARMSAKMVETSLVDIKEGNDQGHKTVLKALGGSGVAMSIAGSSRPASGSEHLVSHSLDFLLEKQVNNRSTSHGEQVGIASIVCMFLHGGERWKELKQMFEDVGAPTSFQDLGIDYETVLNAMLMAHTIRPRYTILGTGLTENATKIAIDKTGVCQ